MSQKQNGDTDLSNCEEARPGITPLDESILNLISGGDEDDDGANRQPYVRYWQDLAPGDAPFGSEEGVGRRDPAGTGDSGCGAGAGTGETGGGDSSGGGD